jgi:hypothetical protein
MTTITMMLTLCRRAITLKLLISQKQQSRLRAPTPDGFALSPIRAVFLDGIRWVVEPAVKPVGCAFTVVPVLPLKQGRSSPTEEE